MNLCTRGKSDTFTSDSIHSNWHFHWGKSHKIINADFQEFLCWMSSLVAMATANAFCCCSRHSTDGTRSSEHFLVVQADHQRAEVTDVHKVAAEDVEPPRPAPRLLLARPAEQQRESSQGQGPHVLQGVQQDVRSVFCQVQPADVETICEKSRQINKLSTWVFQFYSTFYSYSMWHEYERHLFFYFALLTLWTDENMMFKMSCLCVDPRKKYIYY